MKWNTFIDILEWLIEYAYRAFEWLYTEPQRLAAEWKEHSTRRSIVVILAGGSFALLSYMYAIAPPRDFPIGLLVSVPEGTSAGEIGAILQEQQVIQQSLAFRVSIMLLGRDRDVRAGDYLFKEPKDVISVARIITTGAFGLEPLRFRVVEGATTQEMAKLYSSQLQRFNSEKFLAAAQPLEGYFFPDTYFFLSNATEEIVLSAMRQNFNEKIAGLESDIAKSGKTLNEIVILASILEREARTYEDRQMIAGVLWRRLKIDMALQVDAAFLYSIGRSTFTLTKADLRNSDDPYNTYVNKGLPPGAIGSPSLSSLKAAVNPIDKGYLFYLADNSNVTHYSKTYEEHLRLKNLYLGT